MDLRSRSSRLIEDSLQSSGFRETFLLLCNAEALTEPRRVPGRRFCCSLAVINHKWEEHLSRRAARPFISPPHAGFIPLRGFVVNLSLPDRGAVSDALGFVMGPGVRGGGGVLFNLLEGEAGGGSPGGGV